MPVFSFIITILPQRRLMNDVFQVADLLFKEVPLTVSYKTKLKSVYKTDKLQW